MLEYYPQSRPPGSRAPWSRSPLEQTPPEKTPPRADTPLPEQTPPRADTPPETPWEADSSIRSMSGQYASYWNAFLFRRSLPPTNKVWDKVMFLHVSVGSKGVSASWEKGAGVYLKGVCIQRIIFIVSWME